VDGAVFVAEAGVEGVGKMKGMDVEDEADVESES
jgi:hypothetical protein